MPTSTSMVTRETRPPRLATVMPRTVPTDMPPPLLLLSTLVPLAVEAEGDGGSPPDAADTRGTSAGDQRRCRGMFLAM